MKTCSKCGEDKPVSDYYKQSRGKDGYRSACKSCLCADDHKYRMANKSAQSLRARRYRDNNLEKCKLTDKKWRENNKENISAKSKIYYEKTRETQLEKGRVRYAKNREQYSNTKRLWRENNKEKIKVWYEANKELLLANSKEYRKINREKLLKISRERYGELTVGDKQVINAKARNWHSKNRERVSKYHANHYACNKGAAIARSAKRRGAKLNRSVEWGDSDAIKSVYDKCKELIHLDGINRHVDHMYPLQGRASSGLHVWENLQVLESHINTSKSNKHPREMVASGWIYSNNT